MAALMPYGLTYSGLGEALREDGVEVRLFGKPESFRRRRMGVALAVGRTVEEARARALEAASNVVPITVD